MARWPAWPPPCWPSWPRTICVKRRPGQRLEAGLTLPELQRQKRVMAILAVNAGSSSLKFFFASTGRRPSAAAHGVGQFSRAGARRSAQIGLEASRAKTPRNPCGACGDSPVFHVALTRLRALVQELAAAHRGLHRRGPPGGAWRRRVFGTACWSTDEVLARLDALQLAGAAAPAAQPGRHSPVPRGFSRTCRRWPALIPASTRAA